MGEHRHSRPRTASLAFVVLGILILSACGSDDQKTTDSGDRSSPPGTMSASESSATPTPSPTSATSASIEESPSGGDEEITPTSTESGSVLSPERAGVPLTLSDFFGAADEGVWEQSVYTVADRQDVSGMAAVVDACSQESGTALDLRLAGQFSTLEFEVGQSANSETTRQSLIVQVLDSSGGLLSQEKVGYDTVQRFKVDVSGVNAAQIVVFLDDGAPDCGYESVDAVVSDVIVR